MLFRKCVSVYPPLNPSVRMVNDHCTIIGKQAPKQEEEDGKLPLLFTVSSPCSETLAAIFTQHFNMPSS